MKRLPLLLLLIFSALPAFAAGGSCPAGATYLNAATNAQVTLASLGVTSCYYASASGVDTATGTDETHPWLHLPGMTGCANNCSSVSVTAGEGFIIQGGSTYHFSGRGTPVGLPWSWSHNGTSNNPIYLGVDLTWFSGSSWTRPVFTGDNSTSTSSGGVASCTHADDNENWISAASSTHIITDHLEATAFCWATGNGLSIFTAGSSNFNTWTNNYVHGWTRQSSCTGDGCAEGAVAFASDNGPDTGPGDPGWHNVYAQNVVDGPDSDNHILTAQEWQCYDIHNSVYNRYANIVCAHHLVYGSQFTNTAQPGSPIPDHGNTFEENGSVQNAGPNAFFNNIIAHNNNGVNVWLNPQVGSTDYSFGNLVFDINNSANMWNVGDNNGAIGNQVIFNNTFENPENSNVMRCQPSAVTYGVKQVNNHVITNGGSATNCGAPQQTAFTTNLVQTHTTATSQGYTAGENFVYSPTLGTNSTVGAGTNEVAGFCAALTSGGNTIAGAACLADTTYACTYDATAHAVSCPARAAVTKPTSAAWDIGAYEFTSATTWYVRPDGGTRYSANVTSGQCDGKGDAAYSGTGTNQHCAFNDFRYLAFDGTSATSGTWVIAGGDIVHIAAGQYRAGYNGPNSADHDGLASAGSPGASAMPPVPSGTSANPTQFIGAGSALTQIYGGYGAFDVIDLSGSSFVTISGIELTRHSQCTLFGVPALPSSCSRSYPLDDYASNGIATNNQTHDIVLNDMNIHGFASRGIIGPIGGTISATNVRIAYNTGAGWDFDDGNSTPSVNGLINLTGVTIEWNGCNQAYPGTGASACYSESSGGYGDGIGTPTGTCISANVTGSTFRYNTQDNYDMLHNDTGSCRQIVTNSTSYGANGSQFKWGPANSGSSLTNSTIVANCFRLSAAFPGQPSSYNANLHDFCRANDAIALGFYNNTSMTLSNNKIITTAPVTLDVACSDPTTCAGSSLTFTNNIVRAYTDPAANYGDNGAPGGWCLPDCNHTTGPIGTITRTNNVYFGLANFTPVATETVADPLFVNEPTGTGASFTEAELDNFNFTLSGGTPATVATPTASPAAGTYTSTRSVALSTVTAGAAICYTIDGSTPAAATAGTCSHGTTHSGAISVATTTTIKALGTLSGDTNSGVFSGLYTITPPAQTTTTQGTFTVIGSVTFTVPQ